MSGPWEMDALMAVALLKPAAASACMVDQKLGPCYIFKLKIRFLERGSVSVPLPPYLLLLSLFVRISTTVVGQEEVKTIASVILPAGHIITYMAIRLEIYG